MNKVTIHENADAKHSSNIAKSGQNSAPRDLRLTKLYSVLEQGFSLLDELRPVFSSSYNKLEALRLRLDQGRLHLAVLGQFKRGKSTFLNALLGEPVLPTSVIPLTSVPTFIQEGPSRKARVLFQNEQPVQEFSTTDAAEISNFLAKFVTEAGNPKNHLRVSQVELFHPADILRNGVVFIDTPGIGSTLRHNTEATLNFLPQCDAALFLVSADPPITEVEIEFLKRVRTKITRLFFLMNKVDYLTPEELQESLRFFRKALKEQAGIEEDVHIFSVSARKGLTAQQSGDRELWKESGLADTEERLVHFLVREKMVVLTDALSRKTADILAEAVMKLRLNIKSLQLPLEELEKKLDVFDRKLIEIERERITTKDLLTGDRRRIHAFLEEHSEQLRKNVRVYLEKVAGESIAKDESGMLNESILQEVIADRISDFFEHEMERDTAVFDKKISETLSRHQARADQLIESVRRTAAELFDVLYHAPESSDAFEIVRKPYWITRNWTSAIQPIPPKLIDKVLSVNIRRRRMLQWLKEQIDSLVVQNVENLRWNIYQSVDNTFVQFGSVLDERLANTVAITHGAIKTALHKHQGQAESVSEEIARLESVEKKMEVLEAAIG